MHLPTLLLATTLTTLTAALPAADPPAFIPSTITTTLDSDDIIIINNNDTAAAAAAAATTTISPLDRRAWAYNPVTYCEGANKGGRCITQALRHALCYNLDRSLNDRLSSIYPGRNTRCRLHRDGNCRGGSRSVGPNWYVADLRTFGWNDVTSSIDCFTQIA